MSVFVDPVCDYGWTLGPSCHMYADSVEELHSFATSIGLKRSWFQDKPDFPHYDLSVRMRGRAVHHGATEETRRQFVENRRGRPVVYP